MLKARLHSRWQKIWQHRVAIAISTAIIVIAIALIIVGYRFDWTGFNGNNKSGKTLWDWLQLLFIPVVLTLGAVWYTAQQNHDREITIDNQREAMLQTYLDKMSELLLHNDLSKSELGDDVRKVAYARTLTVFPKLDPNRKRSIVLFLVESRLIDVDTRIIDMGYIDLSQADLSQVDVWHSYPLDGISLQGANLQGANLSKVNLRGSDLELANLHNANLTAASLLMLH